MKSLLTIFILACTFVTHTNANPLPKNPKAINHYRKHPAVPPEKRKPGSLLDHLPANIEVLTDFGERADFSPDNQRIAFMAKSFGDAMILDLKTRRIKCLTCNVPAATFLRVIHLTTGDYILIGPEKYENIHVSRRRHNEL